MKRCLLFLAVFAALSVPASGQLVSLQLLDSEIAVGDAFDIVVALERNVVDPSAELLSFAFDVDYSGTVSFLGASIAPSFSDDSALIPYDVGGSAFPGVSEPSFNLAVLTFRALAQDEGWVSILGPVDTFGGLKYTTFVQGDEAGFFVDEDFPIEAMVRFEIGEGIIPEPASAALLSLGVLGVLLAGRRRR